MSNEAQSKHLWAGIARQAVSFIVGVVVAAFILGKNSQKVNDMILWKNDVTQRWKQDVAPRIERMDRQGSISFDNFKNHYDEEQAKQYKRLEKLENEVAHLETMTFRIERLEKKTGTDP
jgi:hypothetical protein